MLAGQAQARLVKVQRAAVVLLEVLVDEGGQDVARAVETGVGQVALEVLPAAAVVRVGGGGAPA